MLLRVRNITKRFGGVTALADVSFDVVRGQIVGLIGPNGAGKTTLFNCISGFDAVNSGEVHLDGQPMKMGSWRSFYHAGVRRTFQNTSLFDDMTVLENIVVALSSSGGSRFARAALGLDLSGRIAGRGGVDTRERALLLLRAMGQESLADRECAALTAGQRRLVELTRAAAGMPVIALLDEPAAGLNPTETAELAAHIRRIRDLGITVVVVEHDLRLVMGICDHVVVIEQGRKLAEGPPHMIQRDPAVIEAYIGATGASHAPNAVRA